MRRFSFLLVALLMLVPAVLFAKGLPVHSVWGQKPLALVISGASISPTKLDSSFNWSETTQLGFGNARALDAAGNTYDFQLISITASNTNDQLTGKWNVSKNGVNVCTACTGSAYGLSGAVGNYFKIYAGPTSNFHVSGYITNRYDYN